MLIKASYLNSFDDTFNLIRLMHFKCDCFVFILIQSLFTTLYAKEGNFHDFNSSCDRIHYRCRSNVYPFSVERLTVTDDKVRWDIPWPKYKPPVFTAVSTVGQPWADPDITDRTFNPRWNCVDGLINRRSYVGVYNLSGFYPLNPIGRTGLAGRGMLGRWGPNHAADAVVTRWKRSEDKQFIIHPISNKPVLQLITIQKRNGEWGIPGGMVNPGEKVCTACKREFFEEVLAYEFSSNNSNITKMLECFFNKGVQIYKGYVDDPRNTDNAWVETVAVHYHDIDGKLFDSLKLVAGDDAYNVSWMDVDKDIKLYSSHQKFVQEMTSRLNAHF